jgi:hypothetical protein
MMTTDTDESYPAWLVAFIFRLFGVTNYKYILHELPVAK